MWTIFKIFIEFVIILLLFYVFFSWPQGTWDLSCPTRDQTHTPYIARQNLNHWTTREFLSWKGQLRSKALLSTQVVKLPPESLHIIMVIYRFFILNLNVHDTKSYARRYQKSFIQYKYLISTYCVLGTLLVAASKWSLKDYILWWYKSPERFLVRFPY